MRNRIAGLFLVLVMAGLLVGCDWAEGLTKTGKGMEKGSELAAAASTVPGPQQPYLGLLSQVLALGSVVVTAAAGVVTARAKASEAAAKTLAANVGTAAVNAADAVPKGSGGGQALVNAAKANGVADFVEEVRKANT